MLCYLKPFNQDALACLHLGLAWSLPGIEPTEGFHLPSKYTHTHKHTQTVFFFFFKAAFEVILTTAQI